MGVVIGGMSCDLCGRPFPCEQLEPVYIMQIDETVMACDDCQPEEDPRL